MEPFHIDVHRLVNLQQRDCSGLTPDSLLMSCAINGKTTNTSIYIHLCPTAGSPTGKRCKGTTFM